MLGCHLSVVLNNNFEGFRNIFLKSRKAYKNALRVRANGCPDSEKEKKSFL